MSLYYYKNVSLSKNKINIHKEKFNKKFNKFWISCIYGLFIHYNASTF